MSQQVPRSGESFRRFLWRGIRGESVGIQLESYSQTPTEILDGIDFVARPIPVIEAEEKLWNMRAYIGGVLQITDSNGDVIDNPIVYCNLLNNMPCNDEWIAIGEKNKDAIFHVHTLARTNVRIDSYKRTLLSIWKNVQTHSQFVNEFGTSTLDMVKGQKAHKPCALLQNMCKSPEWIVSNNEKLLQMTYDICTWDLGARFRTQPDDKPDIDKANPMVQELLQLIIEHNCKNIEDVMKKGADIVVKHLHKAGISSIIQNCLTYAKCVGKTWSLKQYGSVVSDPSAIHGILLCQGISPSDFDYIFWQWITKRHAKRNTIHIYGPSNTGKSCFFSGLGKCCPGGEIVNGNSFNFEGLIDCYWGKWEEPLCSPEIAEKCKQIFEGMETAIPVKFKRPFQLPRTPIAITTNSMIWEWCRNQEAPFRNRMWFFDFTHDMSNGTFVPRTTESSCQCRYCELSRGGTPRAGSSTTTSMQRTKQSTQNKLDPRDDSSKSSMGSRSMSDTAGGSRSTDSTGSSGGEPSSDSATGSSTSSTASGVSGSSTKHGSSSTSERVCSTRTRSTESVESSTPGGSDGYDNRSVRRGRTTRTDAIRQHSRPDEILSSMVSMGGTKPKKSKMALQVQTEEQQLGGELGTKLKVPDKPEWAGYLSYIYRRYEQAVSTPDLFAYEELGNSSDSE
nr:MAG: nonstructural protein 1 [Duck parvovirus]